MESRPTMMQSSRQGEAKMGFSAQAKQITVVYAKGYDSAANIIEARIQAFPGYTSRLWDISFYDANKATLDSDRRVIFLGSFDENPAAGAYAKIFKAKEKGRGCYHAIAGSKALIYPTGEESDNSIRLDDGVQFYTDSAGTTRSKNGFTEIDTSLFFITKPTILQKLASGLLGSLGVDHLLKPTAPSKPEQLENGCEEFMEKRFATWVGFTAS